MRSLAAKCLIVGLMAFLPALAGCAAPRVHLSVTGYANPGYAPGLAGATFYVIKNQDPYNSLLDREVARKLEKAMISKGYMAETRDRAGFFLTYSFGLETGPLRTRYAPYHEPGLSYRGFLGYDALGRPIYGRYIHPAYTRFRLYQQQLNVRRLEVRAVDAALMRQEEKKEVVWAGDAESMGPSRDIRSVLDFLISAVVGKLWVDTGKALEFFIPVNDPSVNRIRGY